MRILLGGALGKMGCEMRRLIEREQGIFLAAGIDPRASDGENPMFCRFSDFSGCADVLVDFSHPHATREVLEAAVTRKIPLVLATTGHDDAMRACIEEASHCVPIFLSENLSLGVAMMAELVRRAAAFFPDADIEIIERHHREKADAPSGTALLLAREIGKVRADAIPVYGRQGFTVRRTGEVGIHSLRQGSLLGTHEVIFATDQEILTIRHETEDRALYAKGALRAAAFLLECAPGLFGMEDLLDQEEKV